MDGPTFFYGIWFVGNPRGDWMGKLTRQDSGKWLFEYRFRYYDPSEPDNDAFSGQDKKHWYAFESQTADAGAAAQMVGHLERTLLPILEMRYGHRVDFVDLQCMNDDPKFHDELSRRPWCHMKEVTPEEFEEMKKSGIVD